MLVPAVLLMRGDDMLTRVSETKAGLALAISLGVLYIICFALYAAMPQFAMGMQMMTFHQVGTMGVNTSLEALLYGVFAVLITGFSSGALFAFVYNRLTRA